MRGAFCEGVASPFSRIGKDRRGTMTGESGRRAPGRPGAAICCAFEIAAVQGILRLRRSAKN